MGRSPRFVTVMRDVARPLLASIGSFLRKYSPGIILFPAARYRACIRGRSSFQPNWFVNGDKFRAIGERTFDLNLRDHLGNALHDIVYRKYVCPEAHQLC